MIGRRLGHYEIVEKLGEGGMGAVYRARDTTLGRDVALKLLPEFVSANREKIARLEREAHLLASLNHPNVATLYGLEVSDGLQYLVMELVPGETLAERISRGALGVEECLEIFRQIAEGLEVAHEKGIIHRDLKPANVIVGPEGRVKVLDFGLAKSVAEPASPADLSKSPTLTREGTEHGVILGTAPYMSPEQARGKSLDRRTDIWSFGCVFYEALTGRQAFRGETVTDILAAILEKEPDWSALPERAPAKIRDLLQRCLQKDPHRRLRDIGDARIEIEESRRKPSASPPTRKSHLALAALAFVAVSGLALWGLLGPAEEVKREVSRFTVNLPPEQALTWGNDPSVAISPDGRRLVYVGGSGSERRLYVRPIDHFESRPIPGTEGVMMAFFSPDGEWVAFYGEGAKLKKVRLDSGLPITLCGAHDPYGASWGPQGDILFSGRPDAGLSRVSASGGSPSVVTTPDPKQGETGHRWPEILPDGKTALFTIRTRDGSMRIGLLSLENGEYRVLLPEGSFARYVPTGHLVYTREGALMGAPFDLGRLEVTGESVPLLEGVWTYPSYGTAHFALSRDGTLVYVPDIPGERTLVWVDRKGLARPITETRRAYDDPRLSPDGRRLAITMRDEGLHIWIYEMARDSFTRLTFGPDADQAPVWTPDGERIVFRRGGVPSNVFWVSADGRGSEERLATSEYIQRPDSWSPDGKLLVYSEQDPTNRYDIRLLNLEGERRTEPFLQTPFRERTGILSPDGRFLAYMSDESGTYDVYVRPFPGPGGKWQISNEGGRQPVWARSGREIFYRNGDQMMAVAIETEPAFRAGKPALLFQGEFSGSEYFHPNYDVASDDQSFVMIRGEARTQIHVVLNWFEELKGRVPSSRR